MRINSNGVLRCLVLITAAMSLALSDRAIAADPELSSRSLIIAVAKDAPAEIKAAASAIQSAAKEQPLMKVMAGDHDVRVVDTAALLSGPIADRAFNHVIVIGAANDPLVTTVWQREAKMEDGGIYVFGFGHFKGDIGYIESDRNPFTHSEALARAPYECEFVTITGTTPAGVALAAQAFIHRDIVNGVIANKGAWSRPATSLLDRDAATADVNLPAVPEKIGDAPMIAAIQATGDEYANVLADTGLNVNSIWRFKYASKGEWDTGGMESAIAEYNSGLHRRAYADMLWVGTFASPAAAAEAAKKIATATSLKPAGEGRWGGNGKAATGAPIQLWIDGPCVYMSDLK